jgi:hypothetical protein
MGEKGLSHYALERDIHARDLAKEIQDNRYKISKWNEIWDT